jgi:hypothetical protein
MALPAAVVSAQLSTGIAVGSVALRGGSGLGMGLNGNLMRQLELISTVQRVLLEVFWLPMLEYWCSVIGLQGNTYQSMVLKTPLISTWFLVNLPVGLGFLVLISIWKDSSKCQTSSPIFHWRNEISNSWVKSPPTQEKDSLWMLLQTRVFHGHANAKHRGMEPSKKGEFNGEEREFEELSILYPHNANNQEDCLPLKDITATFLSQYQDEHVP